MKHPFLAALCCVLGLSASAQTTTFTVDVKNTAQTINNIGASACWFSEGIGKYWPDVKKEKMAELLFSRDTDKSGNPKGIGMSAFRFNVGGGTAEQGNASGIVDFRKRVESFLNADGIYDWNKQAGYQWFLRKARDYGVESLIAFSNTPPVQFTQNGLGFKTIKDYKSNLKPDKYGEYADFLTKVIQHFDAEGLHFSHVSPVNEPQWDWSNTPGKASQEGSPWTNREIYHVVKSLDSSLRKAKTHTLILTPEAGQLTYLYGGKTQTSKQIQSFFSDTSRLSFKGLTTVPRVIAGHSYFTDSGDSAIVSVRQKLADTAAKYKTEFWESEYSMLQDGFREGSKNKRSPMDCALFLAKMMNQDLTVANASAWQFWNSFEPGKPDGDTRYYFISLQPNATFTDGDFTPVKNLWAFGNYSLFVRPGMKRVITTRNDNVSVVKAEQDVMISAFTGGKHKLVAVIINYTDQARNINLDLKNAGKLKSRRVYITSAAEADNLRAETKQTAKSDLTLIPRSVTTVVFD